MTYTQRLNVFNSMTQFSQRMNEKGLIADGTLTSRVVGEFSSGKTRAICELFKQQIPENLFPISSLEPETRLPLEITYGEKISLALIEKADDSHTNAVQVLREFTQFPTRQELIEIDPFSHRLRMTLTDERFILPEGDGAYDEKKPMRLFLIDTPGSNSDEDELAESRAADLMRGEWNLNIVYVCHVNRLDGEENQRKLKGFLEALAEQEFKQNHHLIFMITNCDQPNRARHIVRMRQRIQEMWEKLSSQPLDLDLFAYDFAEFEQQPELRQRYQDEFWQAFAKHLNHAPQAITQHPWQIAMRDWHKEWLIQPLVARHLEQRQQMQGMFNNACIEGEWIKGMNMHRLIGLSAAEIQQRLTERWFSQINLADDHQFSPCTALPDQHPLSAWWNSYWQPRMNLLIDAHNGFLSAVKKAIASIQPDTADLNVRLTSLLRGIHDQLKFAYSHSFMAVLDTVEHTLQPQAEACNSTWVASLLQLSLLEASYHDHLTQARLKIA